MKIIQSLFIALLLFASCQKDQIQNLPEKEQANTQATLITIDEAKAWLNSQPDSIKNSLNIDWQKAKNVITTSGNRITIQIKGRPKFQNTIQGYRQLSFQKNDTTGKIEGKILEIIPEAIYFQGKQKVDPKDFTGRIMEFSMDKKLLKGTLYTNGKKVGEARPATESETRAYHGGQMQPLQLTTFEQQPSAGTNAKITMARVIESCYWYQTTYIDSEGVFTVYAERMCSYSFYDDGGGGGGYNDPGIGYDPGSGGGGGGGSTGDPGPPPPAELPMENQVKVDPKKMMDCFSNISSTNAVFQVKVLVLEPQPGTSFNVGINSFGHVAIQLTKASQGQLITQTVGFYPTGSGLDKLVSKSRIIDNGGLEYTMSSTFETDAQSFQKVIDYISNPPANYHYTDFNCAAFVYQAGKAGNLPIPDPTTQIGFGGPGGAGFAMTPQGMAAGLSQQKANNPKADISDAGGRASASKGECK